MSLDIIRNYLTCVCPVDEQRKPICHEKIDRTGWSRVMNAAVMECFFFSRPFDEQGNH